MGISRPHLGKVACVFLSFGTFSSLSTHGAQWKHASLMGDSMPETSCLRRNYGHYLCLGANSVFESLLNSFPTPYCLTLLNVEVL